MNNLALNQYHNLIMSLNTPHQERSEETFFHMETQMGLYSPAEQYFTHLEIVKQTRNLCLYNLAQVLNAHHRKEITGEEQWVHNVTFDN